MPYAENFGSGNKNGQNDPVFSLPGHITLGIISPFFSVNGYDEFFLIKNHLIFSFRNFARLHGFDVNHIRIYYECRWRLGKSIASRSI